METELYKIRGLAKCVKAAYDLFSTNLTTILRRTWLPVTVFVIIFSVGRMLYISQSASLASATWVTNDHWQWILGSILVTLLTIASAIWAYSAAVSLLNGLSVKRNIPRIFRFALLVIAIGFVVGLIMGGITVLPSVTKDHAASSQSPMLYSAISILLLVLLLILAVPAYYSSLKYLIEPQQKIGSVLGKPYRKGWHYWGFLFTTALLTSIIVGVLSLVIMAPNYLILSARIADFQGMSMGDASGLPSYFKFLALIASMISTFIYVYLMIWALMVYYYAYGTLEAKLSARAENATMQYGQSEEGTAALPEDFGN
ncbi:MAG: hypothetical protein ACOYJK_09815 [Prevotella sp.]|jgi:hypothetical protein